MSKHLFKSALTVGSMTFISRVLGLLRETVFAIVFGATAQMDAFLVAFKIPNFMRRLFAEGAFSQAFVPVLSDAKTKYDEESVKLLISHVAGLLGLVVFVFSVFGMIFSWGFVFIFAPGFWDHPEKFYLTESMLRIMFPYLFFIAMTALAGGVLNSYSRFWVPSFTPTLLNIVMIAVTLFAAHRFVHPEIAVAWGVSLAGLIQLLFQLPFLYQMGLLTWPKIVSKKHRHPGVGRILKLMVPAIFGASVVQIGLLIDTLFASFLQTGSVSWLYYSDRLMQFPLGVFGVALGTVVLPHLSSMHAKSDHEKFNGSLNWALKLVVIFALPAAVGLAVLARPMVETIYQYGKFSAHDANNTALALMVLSFGLFFFIAVKVLVSAFYSRQNTKTPVKIAACALVINIILNCFLIYPLAYLGIALATVFASVFNVMVLLFLLHRQKILVLDLRWLRVVLSVLIAVVAMWLVLYLLIKNENFLAMHLLSRMGHLSLLLAIGAVIYLGILWLLGVHRCLSN